MDNIYLSVIIPVYNTEKYLKKCIDSVITAANIADKEVEIIVINDGSKGNCDEIIQNYLNKDNIIYIKQENKGRGATRNVGIEKARGEYITFVDSDDYIDSNMYKDMLSRQADIVVCDLESVNENGEKLLLIPGKNEKVEDSFWSVYDVMMMPSCVNKIFKKSLFVDVSFPENINYEDLATIPEVILKANKVDYIDTVYYYYVQNNDSIMNQEYNIEKLNILEALKIVFSRIDKLDVSNKIKDKAKYTLFTRRYYEEVLEKIALSSNKEELIKEFINKAKTLIEQMENNEFFKKDISSNGIIKKYFNYKLFNYIKTNNVDKILSLLKIKNYYRLISIIYSSKGLR